jgi:hypothetical protein
LKLGKTSAEEEGKSLFSVLEGLESKENQSSVVKQNSGNRLKMTSIDADYGTPPNNSKRKTFSGNRLMPGSGIKLSQRDAGAKLMNTSKRKNEESKKLNEDTQAEIFYLWSTKEKLDFFHAAKKKDIFNLM